LYKRIHLYFHPARRRLFGLNKIPGGNRHLLFLQ
jgi:hypothetical protein